MSIKRMAGIFAQIVTFGAAGRVEAAQLNYEKAIEAAKCCARHLESHRAHAQRSLDILVETKRDCVSALAQIETISSQIEVESRQVHDLNGEHADRSSALATVRRTLASAPHLRSGSTPVSREACVTWALAGVQGIGVAPGAAMAWLGAGVAAPLLAAAALFSHAKANRVIAEIENEMLKLEHVKDEMRALQLKAETADRRATELTEILAKARAAFEHQYHLTYRQVVSKTRPSALWRWLRRLFGGPPHTRDELIAIDVMVKVARGFAKLIDQPVLDGAGEVIEVPS